MNYLFITHDTGPYGAATSLKNLLKHLSSGNIDMLVHKPLKSSSQNLDAIKEEFGPYIQNIYEHYLPFNPCFVDAPNIKPLKRIKRLFFYNLYKNKFFQFIRSKNYDIIHLNSVVLHELIRKNLPTILHVRELTSTTDTSFRKYAQMATGIICIDEATHKPIESIQHPHNRILNNPIDMSHLQHYKTADLQFEFDHQSSIILSCIGNHYYTKGTDFIIKAFRKLNLENAKLLIVGGGEPEFYTKCKKLASGDNRIIFLGLRNDIGKIYRISDVVLGGGGHVHINRITLEALYSGCRLIFPGNESEVSHIFYDYDTFKDQIYCYTPRHEDEFLKSLTKATQDKVTKRIFRSNVENYVKEFQLFCKQTQERFIQCA